MWPACASYRSYSGIGRPVDYTQARSCAWTERLAQQASLPLNSDYFIGWTVGGSLILADIYFNGTGVKRNIPLAMRFACESEAAMASLVLEEMAKSTPEKGFRPHVEFCDYAYSSYTKDFCTAYASEESFSYR